MSKETKLNQHQKHTLTLLYKFRFITAQQLRKYKKLKDIRSINRHLATLLELELISQRYDKSYKLRGKGASYCLTAKGIRLLWDSGIIHEKARNSMYRNSVVKQPFVEHSLEIVEVFLKLRESYPDEFYIFTRNEMTQFDYFPKNPPDLYLNRQEPLEDAINEYMLDICTYMPIFKIKQRLQAYDEHYTDGTWEEGANTEYPAILIVCRNTKTEKSIQRFFDNQLGTSTTIYTTNKRELMTGPVDVWRDCEEPEDSTELK